MQHRCVEIVDAGALLHRLEAKLIGRTQNRAAFHSAARQPHAETVMIVIASELGFTRISELHGRGASKLSAPQNQRVLKHPALLQIGDQRGDRTIDFAGVLADVCIDIVVMIPRLTRSVPELDHADAALQ